MARIRRVAVLAGVAALAASAAIVAGPAQADSPEVFSGNAAGSALDLSVLGKQATFGVSAAEASSTGTAKGRGIGQASSTVQTIDDVVGTYGSDKTAEVKAGDDPVTQGKTCQAPAVELPDFINVGLVCSAAQANSAPNPSASAEASVAEAGLDASVVVKTLEKQTGADTTVIGSTLATALDPLCKNLPTSCPATTTVKDLVASVLKTRTLDITLGNSTSSVTTGAATVTSASTASGAVIKILPLPQADGLPSTEPVVTITVGEAKATATYDRATGKATPSVDPALVRIKFNTVLTDSITLPDGGKLDEIVVKPFDLLGVQKTINDLGTPAAPLIRMCDDNRAVCILPASDFESRIYLATGSTKVNEDGSAVAVADAVRLDLLMGLTRLVGAAGAGVVSDPGVHLALAHAEALVGGRPANVTSTTTTEPPLEKDRGDVPTRLAMTGGLPVAPLLGICLLALAIVLRRATAKATR